MTIGEHLEELRARIILALIGFVLVFVLCLIFVKGYVIPAFCQPLTTVMMENELNPAMFTQGVSDGFMVYIKVSLISALALSSPWLVFQMWMFIASGLYAHERQIVTKYVPLSITLLISGMAFVYFLVLPWTLRFFLAFTVEIPLPASYTPNASVASTQPTMVEVLEGDPIDKHKGQYWFNRLDGRLKIFLGDKVRVMAYLPENLVSPMITLPGYIDLVFGMLITFGLSFQLPLVVMALTAIGIVERDVLKESRRYVYFAMAIVAAAITPGDLITATVALTVPLCLLFELGIWLAREPEPSSEK